jgi:predicted anti-sigma-YlaC factor YlaD
MDCNTYREEFSATLDGEDALLAPGVLATHLARCAACTEWAEAATQLHRATRVASAPDVPDLVAPILATVAERGLAGTADLHTARGRVARLALAAIGVAELITATQGLFGTTSSNGSALHALHELGSFDVALAVGFIGAAFRPSWAKGMLPVVVALVATLSAVTVADVVSAHAGWAAESVHLLAVMGLPTLWIAGRCPEAATPAPWPGQPRQTELRAA